ncbi:MAG TPA: hypothetical protein VK889_09540, partial [Solirubrobacterales bacterium]|nr:hypothetical protein [Solirubrobacterales bacterium]
ESRRAARTAEAAMNAALEAKEAKGVPGPQGPPGPPGPAGSSGAILSSFAAASVTTESESFEQLSGGPQVTVEVPASGLIEVWAQVRFETEGAVALFEDGKKMPGQAQFCGFEEETAALLSSAFPIEPITLATPSTPPFASPFCGVSGAPAGVLFQATPGPHTYELRYQIGCGCEPEATFSNRLLRVAPRL